MAVAGLVSAGAVTGAIAAKAGEVLWTVSRNIKRLVGRREK
ncbi:MAG: hypothetical protein ACJZ2G_05605 [Thalassobaculaceae bacterium]